MAGHTAFADVQAIVSGRLPVSLAVMLPAQVGLSALPAAVLNLSIAVDHQPGRDAAPDQADWSGLACRLGRRFLPM